MAIAVIPARYSATRLPGKPLVSLAGKPMIQRVWEQASQAKRITRVIIATDDERILKAAAAFGAEAVMTRSEHRSGTERVAEVAVHTAAGTKRSLSTSREMNRWLSPTRLILWSRPLNPKRAWR